MLPTTSSRSTWPTRPSQDRVGRSADASAGRHSRPLRAGAPAGGPAHRVLPARHDRDGESHAHAQGRPGRTSCCARRIRSRRRTRSPRRWSCTTASACSPSAAIDADGYYRHLDAAIDTKPNFCIDDGADVIGLMHSDARRRAGRHDGRLRGDHDGRHPPARARGPGAARVPRDRRQRRADQAPLRQPLRHRPVDARRHHPRDQRAARRPRLRRRRLRLVRPRARRAAPAAWAPA